MDVAFRTFALVAMAGSMATAATLVTHQTVARMIAPPQPASGPTTLHQFNQRPVQRFSAPTLAAPRQSVIRQVSFDDETSQRARAGGNSSALDRPLSNLIGGRSSSSRFPFPGPRPDDDDDRRVVSPAEP
jgi:hypothetical protein